MKTKFACFLLVLTVLLLNPLVTQFTIGPTPDNSTVADSVKPKSRLTIGGYGEAVYKYNFYSDNMFRYSHAEKYADAKGHGRVDLPHAGPSRNSATSAKRTAMPSFNSSTPFDDV